MTRAALLACARVAWRQARRAPGRSALVIAMIALPIAALTIGATLIRTSVPMLEEHVAGEMGSAELKVSPPVEVDPRAIEAVLPRGSRVVEIKQWNKTLVIDGTLYWASAWEPSIPIDQPPIPGLYELMEGRAPTRPGEAAVDPRVLEIFEVRIGENLTIGDLSVRVVGVAARPLQMWDPLIVTAPGTLEPTGSGDELFVNHLLVDLPDGASLDAAAAAIVRHIRDNAQDPEIATGIERGLEEGSEMVVTREQIGANFYINDAPRLTGVSFAGTVLALFATGLIAAAAFAVGIRRQLRTLGLIGATGAAPTHLRAVVLLGGTSLGLVGAGIGAAIGIAGAYALTPHLHRFTHSLPGAVMLHPPTIIGAIVLGVLAATAAAARPARLAARISTLDALAARMPPPRPTGRLARSGLIAVAVGALPTGASFRQGASPALLVTGLVLMLGGFLVAVPWLLTVAGRFAPALPTATRLAFRDTARHGRRTGTAIAAAALALTLPVGVAALTLSEEAYQRQNRWMGEDHLLVRRHIDVAKGKAFPPPDGLLAHLRHALPGAIVTTPRVAVTDPERYPVPGAAEPVPYAAYVEGAMITVHEPGGAASSYREGGQLFVGGPDLLRALHADDGIPALEAGKVVTIGSGTSDDGVVHLVLPSDQPQPPRIRLPAVEAGDIRYYMTDVVPRYVISEEGAARFGLLPGSPEWDEGAALVAARAPLTEEQITAVKDVTAQYPGVYVQTLEDFLPRHGPLRAAAIGGAALIALAIVAVTIALVGAEARRDQAILVAVGAGPRARRRIAAARAGLVALLAGVIAVPAGFTPIAVIQWSRPESLPIVVPWATMALVALAVPAVAALFGGLTSRAPRSRTMLQPIA